MAQLTKNHSVTTLSKKGLVQAAVKAEIQKGRHAAPRRIALFAPLPFSLLGMLAGGVSGGGAIGGFATVGWNYWYALMLPIVIALITASIATIDARHNLRSVLGLPFSPAYTWWAKMFYALVLILGSNLVILVASVLAGLLGTSVPPFVNGLATVAVLVLGTAWMVPAGLFLTQRFGTLIGIAVPALLQLALSILFWTNTLWFLFPPATTLCAVSPFTGVAPSGVPLEPGDPLGVFGWEAIVGLAIALALFASLAALGAKWYSEQEAEQ